MRHAQYLLILEGLLVVALVGACSSFPAPQPLAAANLPTPATSSLSPRLTTPTTDVTANLRPGERLLAVGVVRALAIDDSAVYAETSPYATTPVSPQSIVRIDRRSGKITNSGTILTSPGQLLSTGRWLWTQDWQPLPWGGHHAEIVKLDAVTLAVRQRISLPEELIHLAVSPTSLWVGAPTRLLRLDPQTGHITSSIALSRGDGTGMATDPSGRLLYIAQANVGLDPAKPNQPYTPVVLTERDATTGALLATRSDLPSVVGASLSPIDLPEGVWISFPTGMMGQVQLLRASDLATIASVSRGAGDSAAGTNSTTGTWSGGVLWVTDQVGMISCADPNTGRLRSTRNFPATIVVSDGFNLYAATDGGLALLSPDPACT